MENMQVNSVDVLEKIKETLKAKQGVKMRFKTNLGRCRVLEVEGYVESVYPNVFVIRLCEDHGERHVSYTYTDILTKIVEVYDCSDGSCVFSWIN